MNFFKKHFIPGPHNDHQPHILRRKAVFLILAFVLIIEFIFLVQMLYIIPYTDIFSAVLSNVLIDLTNSDRLNNNLIALETNPLLETAAKLKAEDMATLGYFSHTSPIGKTPWEWLDEVGYNFRYAGENLAVNFSDSTDVEEAWMNSASHKKNILNNNFTQVGIGTATGIYKNKEAVFVVQFFGRPITAKPVVAINTTVPPKETEEPLPTKESAVKGEETFIAIQNNEPEPVLESQEETIQPDEKLITKTSILEKALVMPKRVTNYIYLFIAGFVLLALILKIVIKIRVQYPKLIFNGVIILFVICSILYLNSLVIGQGYVF